MLPRMTVWLLVSIALAAVVYLTMPLDPGPSQWARFLVVVNKINLVTIAGFIAYWLDRTATPYGRPDKLMGEVTDLATAILAAAAMLRRAIIMGSCMLAVGLGT